jgi:hypothetical protein
MSSGGLDFPEITAVYARFEALTALSRSLAGELVLYLGLDRDGIAVAMASNVAGAASLGIEPSANRAKDALRAGVCDFVVNNLDEALRILKNEIRKRRPVSVVVTADLSATIAEIVARGVQPEILAFPVKELMDRGARLIPVDAEAASTPVAWSADDEARRSLAMMDRLAASSIGMARSLADARVRWIEASPRYLGRAFAGQRYVRMTEVEADAFVAAVRAAVRTGAISPEISMMRNDEAISTTP